VEVFGGTFTGEGGQPAPDLFVLIWLVFWAGGELWAGSIVGCSTVTVEGGALATRWQMPLVGRTKSYDAAQVRHLRAATLAWPFAGFGRMGRAGGGWVVSALGI